MDPIEELGETKIRSSDNRLQDAPFPRRRMSMVAGVGFERKRTPIEFLMVG
jgi:hypothetical protein